VEKEEFVEARTRLDKTQKEMSQLLGVSVKAIYSYEQGWRSVPTHVERQVFFLLSRKRSNGTICDCKVQKNWKEKMKICRECIVMKDFL
jgi:DNA-binding XRE family transcriptional regulator